QAHHLQLHPRRGVAAAPVGDQLDRLIHEAVLGPLRVEVRRFVGDADVLAQRGNDAVVPQLVDEGLGADVIHGCSCLQTAYSPRGVTMLAPGAGFGNHKPPLTEVTNMNIKTWLRDLGPLRVLLVLLGLLAIVSAPGPSTE